MTYFFWISSLENFTDIHWAIPNTHEKKSTSYVDSHAWNKKNPSIDDNVVDDDYHTRKMMFNSKLSLWADNQRNMHVAPRVLRKTAVPNLSHLHNKSNGNFVCKRNQSGATCAQTYVHPQLFGNYKTKRYFVLEYTRDGIQRSVQYQATRFTFSPGYTFFVNHRCIWFLTHYNVPGSNLNQS